MSHHPLSAGLGERIGLNANLGNQLVRCQTPITREQRSRRRHVARIFDIALFEYVGDLAQLLFVGEVDGVADHHVGGAHGVSDDRRHPPRFARVGILAPENHGTIGNVAPNHRSICAALHDRRVQPRDSFSIDDIDAAGETVVGGNDEHIHASLDLSAIVDHIGDGNRRLFRNQWHGTHNVLRSSFRSKFQVQKFNVRLGLLP